VGEGAHVHTAVLASLAKPQRSGYIRFSQGNALRQSSSVQAGVGQQTLLGIEVAKRLRRLFTKSRMQQGMERVTQITFFVQQAVACRPRRQPLWVRLGVQQIK
jgi:hypothetical protein